MSLNLRLNRLRRRHFTAQAEADLRKSASWIEVRETIFRVLAPYPEIRVKLARELMELDLAGHTDQQ